MRGGVKNDVSLLGADWLGVLAGLERKGLIFEHLCQLAAFEFAKVPTLCRSGSGGGGFCQLIELCTALKLGIDAPAPWPERLLPGQRRPDPQSESIFRSDEPIPGWSNSDLWAS